jgi:prophage tail gpP-like protein
MILKIITSDMAFDVSKYPFCSICAKNKKNKKQKQKNKKTKKQKIKKYIHLVALRNGLYDGKQK